MTLAARPPPGSISNGRDAIVFPERQIGRLVPCVGPAAKCRRRTIPRALLGRGGRRRRIGVEVRVGYRSGHGERSVQPAGLHQRSSHELQCTDPGVDVIDRTRHRQRIVDRCDHGHRLRHREQRPDPLARIRETARLDQCPIGDRRSAVQLAHPGHRLGDGRHCPDSHHDGRQLHHPSTIPPNLDDAGAVHIGRKRCLASPDGPVDASTEPSAESASGWPVKGHGHAA
jgi:hypothetical protein